MALLLWIVSNRIVERAILQPTFSSALKTPTPQPTGSTETSHPVCDVGPYKVEAGENLSILLRVKQGQKVKGHLVEVENQPFDWYIMDEKNMILLKNGHAKISFPLMRGSTSQPIE